ncbi:META domain-containing protein [Myroides sp. JBRI-B21084]|uniref:META domain-containing protein n=1 Tax=Myroides sp. JBRI-B21084 TaxID=3119977 RepID=UPI0026E2EF5D|nr:META domain-containing protein [Paenimyroides cloacae]WKW45579.1 META domain-containing protein [Paenimyroides cloacae]
MKKIVSISLFFLFNLIFMSCGCSQNCLNSEKATSTQIMEKLNNTTWVLSKLDIQNRDFIPTENQKELVLNFSDGRYGSNDGCNTLGGDFNVEDNKISFVNGISTMRFCGDEMKHLIYSVPFGKIKSLKINKNQLQFFDADKQLIATYLKKNL